MTLTRFFKDIKLAEKAGILKTVKGVDGKDCLQVTRIGYLWSQYERHIDGEYIDSAVLRELKFFNKLNTFERVV